MKTLHTKTEIREAVAEVKRLASRIQNQLRLYTAEATPWSEVEEDLEELSGIASGASRLARCNADGWHEMGCALAGAIKDNQPRKDGKE